MKKNEIRFITVLIIITVIVCIIAFVRNHSAKNDDNSETAGGIAEEEFVDVLDDGTKLNTSDKLSQKKEVEGLTFENIQLTNRNGQSVLLATVTNTNGYKTEMTLVDVVILDKDGKTLGTVSGIVAPLAAGASTQFNTSMTMDYANAYDFRIEVK